MTWLNPRAWAGLAAVALPVLIHLLGRARARVQRFPSLRYIDTSRLLPRRFSRPHDALLLGVRAAIVAAAVAALARPVLGPPPERSRAPARAIIIDTSASVQRAEGGAVGVVGPVGVGRGIVAARRLAERLAGEAGAHLVLETDAPGILVAGAVAWLSRQGAPAELVVVSDFQRGALDASDVASVPLAMGVRLARVAMAAAPRGTGFSSRVDGIDLVARVSPRPGRTDVEWMATQPRARNTADAIILRAGAAERAHADASVAAAASIGVPLPVDTSRAVAVVLPAYERRHAVLGRAQPPAEPWMAELLAGLGADSLVAGMDTLAGQPRLLLFPAVDSSGLATASLIAAVALARSAATSPAEFEPEAVPAATLASWERPPAMNPPAGAADGDADREQDDETSGGRALWVATLVLLGVEALLRRAPRTERQPA